MATKAKVLKKGTPKKVVKTTKKKSETIEKLSMEEVMIEMLRCINGLCVENANDQVLGQKVRSFINQTVGINKKKK